MTVKGNILRNCLETMSYQPLRGEPWPTDILFAENVIYNADEDFYAGKGIWNGAFKWGITGKNWDLPWMGERPAEIVLPGAGVDIRDNAVFFAGGMLIKNVNSMKITGFRMHDNVIVAESLIGDRAERDLQTWATLMAFDRNYCAPDRDPSPGPGPFTAGPSGVNFETSDKLADSPAAQAILRKAGLIEVLPIVGRVAPAAEGTFVVQKRFVFKMPQVGPRSH